MRKFVSWIAVSAALAVAGCAAPTISTPVSVGPDTWLITLSVPGGLTSNNDLLMQTIQQATAFCAASGKKIGVQSTSSDGVQGKTAQENQVIFKCLT